MPFQGGEKAGAGPGSPGHCPGLSCSAPSGPSLAVKWLFGIHAIDEVLWDQPRLGGRGREELVVAQRSICQTIDRKEPGNDFLVCGAYNNLLGRLTRFSAEPGNLAISHAGCAWKPIHRTTVWFIRCLRPLTLWGARPNCKRCAVSGKAAIAEYWLSWDLVARARPRWRRDFWRSWSRLPKPRGRGPFRLEILPAARCGVISGASLPLLRRAHYRGGSRPGGRIAPPVANGSHHGGTALVSPGRSGTHPAARRVARVKTMGKLRTLCSKVCSSGLPRAWGRRSPWSPAVFL